MSHLNTTRMPMSCAYFHIVPTSRFITSCRAR